MDSLEAQPLARLDYPMILSCQAKLTPLLSPGGHFVLSVMRPPLDGQEATRKVVVPMLGKRPSRSFDPERKR